MIIMDEFVCCVPSRVCMELIMCIMMVAICTASVHASMGLAVRTRARNVIYECMNSYVHAYALKGDECMHSVPQLEQRHI